MKQGIDITGLSQKKALENLEIYGKNVIHDKGKTGLFVLFIK